MRCAKSWPAEHPRPQTARLSTTKKTKRTTTSSATLTERRAPASGSSRSRVIADESTAPHTIARYCAAGYPHRYASLCEQRQCAIGVRGRHQRDHANAHVERALQFRPFHLAEPTNEVEDRRRRPRRPVDLDIDTNRQHPVEVGRQPPARDMRERMHVDVVDPRKAIEAVDTGRHQQLFPEGAAEIVDVLVESQAGPREQHVPHE